jgi:hypothetical protein
MVRGLADSDSFITTHCDGVDAAQWAARYEYAITHDCKSGIMKRQNDGITST